MDGINRIQGVKRTLGIKSKIVQKTAYRQQYTGVDAGERSELKIESVSRTPVIQKYKDNAGVLSKKLDRVLNYKEEYRRYYQLEQDLEESYDEPEDNMDFVDHLYVVLTDMNEVILALRAFDKTFNTAYSQLIGTIIKNHEESLTKTTVLVHVDYTLGFFKGRLKKGFELHPEYFDFYIENELGLIPQLLSAFRSIKAIIPEKIDELSSSKQDSTGAVIDHKL